MFCAKCQRDVAFCTCPDIDERLRGLSGRGGPVVSVWCKICDKHRDRCTCDNPVTAVRQDGVARALPDTVPYPQLPADRPVFATDNQPCYDPTREVRGMTRVVTKSGSVYRFRSEGGRTFIEAYEPHESSLVDREQMQGQPVTYSEFPIEPGFPLLLWLENGYQIRSTPIEHVDLETDIGNRPPRD